MNNAIELHGKSMTHLVTKSRGISASAALIFMSCEFPNVRKVK